ncbi:MAG: Hsp20 family protein [Chakrabartia sp.]
MRTVFDFTPYRRSTVGFDRLFDTLENLAQAEGNASNYPPYDIERTGQDAYRITIAVAGFAEDEIELTAQQNLLIVRAKKAEADTAADQPRDYLHRGIATRAFERRFQLADHVEVRAARLENGLLALDLVREVPEAMKPRRIAIANSNTASLIDATGEDREAA